MNIYIYIQTDIKIYIIKVIFHASGLTVLVKLTAQNDPLILLSPLFFLSKHETVIKGHGNILYRARTIFLSDMRSRSHTHKDSRFDCVRTLLGIESKTVQTKGLNRIRGNH